jgi:hypothetical protein
MDFQNPPKIVVLACNSHIAYSKKKNKGRKSEAQKARELEFAEKLNQLFDIAHADAVTKIKTEQDKELLNDQRTDRKMIMTTEDKKLAEKQQRSEQRRQKEEERKRKASQ